MNWSLIVSVCHFLLLNGVETPACHEEIAFQHRDRGEVCQFAQLGIAQWKGASRYADDEFFIGSYRCTPDTDAFLKDAT